METEVVTQHKTNLPDVYKIREDFPILSRKVNGQPLVYLDNAASSQKPIQVIDAVDAYYRNEHSNIHRGVHYLSAHATERYEEARGKLQRHINAAHAHEIIFTKGTTDSINLVASSFGRKHLKAGDEVLISTLEHHSNIVPWQLICEEKGAHLRVLPVNDAGEIEVDRLTGMLTDKTRIVAVNHVSNSLGTINPIKDIIAQAHARNIPVLIDGAQAAPHLAIDVQELDCDFYALSSHKMYGPTGVGILYGKEALLEDMPPYQGGGDMIKTVTFEKTIYNELPFKFEAGTPHIAGGIGFGAAVDYLQHIGMDVIAAMEDALLQQATEAMQAIDGLRIIGTSRHKAAVISFLVGSTHPYDTGTILDQMGIAVRTGHHCTEPLMNRFGVPGTARASFSFYNTEEEVVRLVEGIRKSKQMLE
ncbi:MAG: cysteine desulfurase [Flavobacteriales bacterium]|nr:cysteine desulfurase [Flavobacteriales bacterium]MCB9446732.1 cysteine desulfurase [Flavobacteriales bacterium]